MFTQTTVVEIDDDVFQITTQHEDGAVTVDVCFGHDAYVKHMQADTQKVIEDVGEHTLSSHQGRVAGTRNQSWMWH